jgi:hypothetical protein
MPRLATRKTDVIHLPISRRARGPIAALAAAILLAACSAAATPSLTPPPDPAALLTGSLAATSKLSGPLDVTLTIDGQLAQAAGPTMDVSGSKLVVSMDPAGKQGELTLDLKGVQPSTDITADVRVVGGSAYLQASPIGATWYSLPLATAEGLVPSTVPVPSAVPSLDPAAMLAPYLQGSGVKITSGGTQQLDGRDQDVVMVTVSGTTIATWLARLGSMAGSSVVPLPSLPPTMPDIPLTFWIDHQSNQLSKVSTTIADSGSSLTLALTITAHAGALTVQAPPADQTQDAGKLLQMLMGSGAGGANPFGNLFASPAP